ncbi:MAG: NAD(P)H-hydrate dehydratase, partial [Thermodesulfobacteriota bacterium]
LNGYTGTPSPEAVRADITVSFECPKLGIFMPQAPKFTGELYTPKIGIPAHILKDKPPQCQGLNSKAFSWLPELQDTDHKSSAGHLLIIGGSPGLTGAPTLAALGALKSGAGLCTVACPKQLAPDIKQGWPEIMTLPLGPGKYLAEASFAELRENLPRFDAVVLGPGIGRQEGTRAFMQSFLQCSERPPALFDADALYWLARDPELLNSLKKEDVLTPHPGEMARLNRKEISDIQNARLDNAQEFADSHPGVLVLKGAGTIIAAQGENTYISPFSCPNLAVGGSGDVLAGIIGSLKARKLDSIKATCLGVYWHGSAGEILEHHYPCRGNLAQDIAHYLPFAAASNRKTNGDKQCN